MTLDPILHTDPAIQIHLGAASLAIAIGPVALYRKRRDVWHRSLGRVWVGAMALLAISGFFIPARLLPVLGPFGPIHLFSIWALYALTTGMLAILRRDVATHQAIMRTLYWQALGVAGLLTLLPGRRLNAVVFGDAQELGIWVIGTIGLAVLALRIWRRKQAATPGI
ncbi:DUF2306 domain-containing protein [Gymnodinialimonas sp. 2305UL16-5]|uniref:DUF2306 domain-containing protein n=1 Tax=Gymnodinialimonas mytili TaxID=3126503 RepID=UPI0030A74C64